MEDREWWEPQSGGLVRSSVILKVNGLQEGPIALKLSQKIAKCMAYSVSSTSRVVIFSKVAAYTSQPVAFNGHLSTRGRLTNLRNKPQQKQTHQHLAVVYW